MLKNFRGILTLLLTGLVLSSVIALAATGTKDDGYQARENDAYSIGVQAYIYGLAPVIIERTERAFTSTPGPGHAPVNQFGHVRHLATPDDAIIVTPNADTLYSSAWLELGKGPIVLHVPDTQGRYYVMQMIDAYTNDFAYVGRRTTGTGAGDFAIAGPGWNGSIPGGMQAIRSPTNTVWIAGRILVNGPGDVSNVTALQDQFTLTPLSRYGTRTANASQDSLSDFKRYASSPNASANLTFFEELRVALKNNPPPAREDALMAVFSQIGLAWNATPYGSGLNPAVAEGLARSLKDGDGIVKAAWKDYSGTSNNGWQVILNVGTYGYDYLTRAVVAEGALAANNPEEAVYPRAQVDSDGKPLNGAHRYVMCFEKGNTPPVDAFWSITPYNASNYMLMANPIDRYAIGDRTTGLKYNPDGSLDIYIQHDPPVNTSNWLPAPEGDFYLVLRMYQPKPAVLNDTYRIPPVTKVG